jgi:hypothetical protein
MDFRSWEYGNIEQKPELKSQTLNPTTVAVAAAAATAAVRTATAGVITLAHVDKVEFCYETRVPKKVEFFYKSSFVMKLEFRKKSSFFTSRVLL